MPIEKEGDVDVLFVEDNLDDSVFTQYALTQTNDKMKFLHLRDGADALDFIFARNGYAERKSQSGLKFVILDVGLPNMTGLEVLRLIRAEIPMEKLPVIMLSSSRDRQDIEEAYHLGANSYVVKPDGFDRYINKVSSVAHYWSSVNENAF